MKIEMIYIAHSMQKIMDIVEKIQYLYTKKETNTLYTVNALNEVIKDLNNGILDKTMIIPWEAFENSFILTEENGYRRIDLVFVRRINF
jgi:hypothetical protein